MSTRLPTAAAFASLSSCDQGAILDWHGRQLDEEEATVTPDTLAKGHAFFTNGVTLASFKRSLRARRARLRRLAVDFGFWQDDEAKAA